MVNYYELLGISTTATTQEIEAAYRSKVSQHHPDRNLDTPGPAAARFKQCQEAYETLRDPARRKAYDLKFQREKLFTEGWAKADVDLDYGGLTLHANGEFTIGTRRISADSVLKEVKFRGFHVEKGPHTEGELWFLSEDRVVRFRFLSGDWYCLESSLTAAQQPGDAKPTSTGHLAPRLVDPFSLSTILAGRQRASSPPPPPIARARKFPMGRWILVGVGMAACLALGAYLSTFLAASNQRRLPLTAEEQAQQIAEENRQRQLVLDEQRKQEQIIAEETRRAQQTAMRRSQLIELQHLGELLQTKLTDLQTETDAWAKLASSLPTDNEGKRLASNPDFVRAFYVLQTQQAAEPEQIAPIRRQVDELLRPVQQALADTTASFAPGTDYRQRLTDLATALDKRIARAREPRLSVEQMLRLTESSGTTSAKTLQQAIDEMLLDDAVEKNRRIAEANREETRRAAEQAAADELRRLQLQHEEEALVASRELSERKQKLEHDKNLAEAQLPEVQKALTVLFAKGFIQPKLAPHGFAVETELKPISYSQLRLSGHLDQSEQGLQLLHNLITTPLDDKRPRWGGTNIAASIGGDKYEQLIKMQDYLRRLGDALVELGKLAP